MGRTAIRLARIGLIRIQESKPMGVSHSIALTNLAETLSCHGAPEQAKNCQKLLERALQIFASLPEFYTDPELSIPMYGSLGIVCSKLGMTVRAVELLEHNHKIIEICCGLESEYAAVNFIQLGKAYGVLGDTEKRHKLLEQALGIRERIFGPVHMQVASSITSLSIHIDDLTRKQQLLERALGIMEREVGLHHPHTQVTIEHLLDTYSRLGNKQKHSELRVRTA